MQVSIMIMKISSNNSSVVPGFSVQADLQELMATLV